MKEDVLQVLIVDDTVVYRSLLKDVVAAIPGISLAATASNGKLALEKMERLDVDLVFLDVEMPVMDGLKTLEEIQERGLDVGVIMISGVNRDSADRTMSALGKGALDFVLKPEGKSIEENRQSLIEHLRPLVQLFITRRNLRGAKASGKPASFSAASVSKQQTLPRKQPVKAAVPARMAPRPTSYKVLAIGVSTGGPNALAEVIPRLPADLGVPVLIVQHMPPLFTKSLADSLDRKSKMRVCEGKAGEPILPNTVTIAPGGKHMVVRRAADGENELLIGLNDNPPENSCRPSVDVLFRSISAQYNGHMLAVIMTGMGLDGCEGVRVMKRRGCYCLSQEESSCVVYGMPQAVDTAGLSDESVHLENLAERITAVIKKTAVCI
jgi:two-component system chemotaxis response regulator CheB